MPPSTTLTPESTDVRTERRTKYHEADVVVVGAGIFGCAVAYALGKQGRSVLLLERWMKEPDRIVGEFLQPGGVAALRKLGLGHCLEGIDAITCHGYDIIYYGQSCVLQYPHLDASGRIIFPQAKASANGYGKRPEGKCFHHGRFIMQLRKACQQQSNITVVETVVTKPIRGQHNDQILGVESMTIDPSTGQKVPDYFFGQLTIVADGYASMFRKDHLGSTPTVRSKFYALELIDCPLPNQGYGHVVIGKAAPTLIYQIGTRETRALFDVPEKLPAAAPAAGGVRGYIKNTVLPTLPEQIQPSVERALQDGRIPRSMPNSWLPPTKQRVRGLVVLGDAMNMRHPLTGGGMTVAFKDVVLLSELLSPERIPDLTDAQSIQAAMDQFYWRRKSLASIINVLAQALYTLFAAQDRQLAALQRGCFEYFQRGMGAEPMGLLGGVVPEPFVLAYHFFSVAFLAIWMHALDITGRSLGGLWKTPLVLIDAVLILWKACVVFLPLCYSELT